MGNGITGRVLMILVALVTILGGAVYLDARVDSKVEKSQAHILQVLTPQLEYIMSEVGRIWAKLESR